MTVSRLRLRVFLPRVVRFVLATLATLATLAAPLRLLAQTGALEPIEYTLRVVDAEKHSPASRARADRGRASIDLMMPVWTPGYTWSKTMPVACAISWPRRRTARR